MASTLSPGPAGPARASSCSCMAVGASIGTTGRAWRRRALPQQEAILDVADLAEMPFGHPMRALFALDPGIAFLNNGSFGACPLRVLEVQDAIRREMERQPVAFFAEIGRAHV